MSDEALGRKSATENSGYLLEGWTLLPAFTVVENIAIPYLRHFEARPEDARSRRRGSPGILRHQGSLLPPSPAIFRSENSGDHGLRTRHQRTHKPKENSSPRNLQSFTMQCPSPVQPINVLGSTVIWSGEGAKSSLGIPTALSRMSGVTRHL